HVECAEHPVSVVRHPLGTVDSPSCYGECCGISVFGSPVALCGGTLVAEHPSWFPLLLLYMGGCSPREGNLPGRNVPEGPDWKVVVYCGGGGALGGRIDCHSQHPGFGEGFYRTCFSRLWNDCHSILYSDCQ